MCGIGGIVGWRGERSELERMLRRMNNAMAHRGPDDDGIWISPRGDAGLCHRRLSILDLSPLGRQPMEKNGNVIVFNGEIYNHHDLRKIRKNHGHVFLSQSDTETLLVEWQEAGPSCLDQLEGMFAFAVWNEVDQSIALARDPLGIKPLYYAESNGSLVFASELRALMASGLLPSKIDGAAIYAYLESGSIPEPLTLWENVRVLESGHYGLWNNKRGLSKKRYWKLAFPRNPENLALEESVTRTREALHDSIKRHFVSDVPVGLFLSGGMDSGAVAAISSEYKGPGLNAFALVFDDPEFDETFNIKATAQAFSLQLTTVKLDEQKAREMHAGYLEAMDQPSVDGLNSYCVSAIARAHGAKVVLSGLGGDELFGGYGTFVRIPKFEQLGQKIHTGNSMARAVGNFLSHPGMNGRWNRLCDWLGRPPGFPTSYRLLRGIFSRKEIHHITHVLGLPQRESHDLYPNPDFNDPRENVAALEMSCYMRNQLLRDSDVMSMAHGLELRVPFVDRKLFEAIAAIPPQHRYLPSKQLLSLAVPRLPAQVTQASKRGFSFPMERWNLDQSRSLEKIGKIISLYPWFRRTAVARLENWINKYC